MKKIKDKKGLTLIEVLVSVAILAIIITPMLAMFTTAYRTTVFSQEMMDGTYIAQSVIEEYRSMDYPTLVTTPSTIQPYDSDGDGSDDCFIRVQYYPIGVHNDLASSTDPSYLHIIYLGDETLVVGTNGVYKKLPNGNMTLTFSDSLTPASLTVGEINANNTLDFKKLLGNSPLIVIVNTTSKSNGDTYSLTVNGPPGSVNIVQYALDINIDEFACDQLDEANIYHGINDYNTSLVHVEVQVFKENAIDTEIGYMEDTFEILNRTVIG